MCKRAADAEPEPAGENAADSLRQAIDRDYSVLFRRVSVLVYRVCGPLRREEIRDRVTELINEAVERALRVAERFDPSRSGIAWLMGFAARILQEQRRGRSSRAIVQSDLGDDNWRRALEGLCAADGTATTRLDIRQALARLEDRHRRILELRYFEGLDGEELARAVDAPSAGAARVRLARALRCLREQFGSAGGEVMP